MIDRFADNLSYSHFLNFQNKILLGCQVVPLLLGFKTTFLHRFIKQLPLLSAFSLLLYFDLTLIQGKAGDCDQDETLKIVDKLSHSSFLDFQTICFNSKLIQGKAGGCDQDAD